jgi:hypothetical protein
MSDQEKYEIAKRYVDQQQVCQFFCVNGVVIFLCASPERSPAQRSAGEARLRLAFIHDFALSKAGMRAGQRIVK